MCCDAQERDCDPHFALLDCGVIQIGIGVQEERANLRELLQGYRNRPMSLADACMVRMSETYRGS